MHDGHDIYIVESRTHDTAKQIAKTKMRLYYYLSRLYVHTIFLSKFPFGFLPINASRIEICSTDGISCPSC
jgi:hypothetical protein